jgi:hypothetical protein
MTEKMEWGKERELAVSLPTVKDEEKYGHESRRGSKPRRILLARTTSSVLNWTDTMRSISYVSLKKLCDC